MLFVHIIFIRHTKQRNILSLTNGALDLKPSALDENGHFKKCSCGVCTTYTFILYHYCNFSRICSPFYFTFFFIMCTFPVYEYLYLYTIYIYILQGAFANNNNPTGTECYLYSKGVVYSCMGPINLTMYQRLCTSDTCVLLPTDELREKSIFMLSAQTGAGDEIGWDFINAVLLSRTSFTGFCNEMTRKYKTGQANCGHFMSPNTFISWLFAWLSAFKIDFRKEIDPWCKHNPKLLACDGTHIGVAVRNMKLDHPITQPDEDRVVHPKHKRYINKYMYLSKEMF